VGGVCIVSKVVVWTSKGIEVNLALLYLIVMMMMWWHEKNLVLLELYRKRKDQGWNRHLYGERMRGFLYATM